MKCDHCTRKECSKKTKTDDQENAAVNVWSRAQENGEKGEFHKVADARIFLSDCLVCDSCVTAEEGVQVSQQNTKDFFHVLNLNKKCDPHSTRCWQCPCVLSLCFILLLNSTSVSLMHPEGSEAFSKALGCTVFDMKIAADFGILESQKEFVRRYCQHHEEEPRLPMLTAACPSWDRYAECVLGHPSPPPLHGQVSPADPGLSGEGLLHQRAEPVLRQDFPRHHGLVL